MDKQYENKDRQSHRYFLTLADFIIVATILGILASIALPKFTNVIDKAKKNAALNISGALQSAVNIAHAKWVASNKPATISIESADVVMNNHGWPTVDFSNTDEILTVEGCIFLWNSLLKNPPKVDAVCDVGSKCKYSVEVKNNSQCLFVENQKSSHNAIQYDINTGRVLFF